MHSTFNPAGTVPQSTIRCTQNHVPAYTLFNDPSPAMKLYNEKEIGAILKRAAELSQDESGTNAAGLSIEELQQVGSEAGLDPDMATPHAAAITLLGPINNGGSVTGPDGGTYTIGVR